MVYSRYVVRLVNNGYRPEDSRMILSNASNVCIDAGLDAWVEVRDVRVASKHIELDVSVEQSMLDKLLREMERIAQLLGYTEIDERSLSKEERIMHARDLFNAERYWEAHEVLEGAWKDSKGDEKELIQGIILVCAALVHAQKAEYDICISILARALKKLQGKPCRYHGLDIEVMVERIRMVLDSKDIRAMLEHRL
ncbi:MULTISPECIES: DUF309 domain-containing protein [Candidatus Nitrosocaldus]|jgi:predicted metal-dependent hydrolase|uniref:DUF309 domain-containing protein n=1 Tax=Candidatus Nitrosocaldus cavascurensis TaxID=2058097 RepID=A0A2K5ARV5_9ARCH|nr:MULTISPECIES: DUF309 domain-containing protein [Candidatus Nitrosocaldus]SPC34388.1 conserved protein of unknown function [Candidatus Nitrosocaldus cavascurensis]